MKTIPYFLHFIKFKIYSYLYFNTWSDKVDVIKCEINSILLQIISLHEHGTPSGADFQPR